MRKTAVLMMASLLWGAASLPRVQAQECEIPVAVVADESVEGLPGAAATLLENALTRMALSSGLSTELRFTDLVLTAHVDVLGKDVLPGPPVQVSTQLGVTLYLGNVATRTKYASAYVEVAGVGTNETKCLVDAFRRLSASQAVVKRMMADGRRKMLDYYDSHYEEILQEARRKAGLQQYEEAIALAVSVPACSRGGEEATGVGLGLYMQYFDKLNLSLLNRARALWAAGGDAEAARSAGQWLALVDPEAECYAEAVALMEEMKAQVRSDIDFEMREKYKDGVSLETARIEAVRAIGVAYGKGQQPRTTNLSWLR